MTFAKLPKSWFNKKRTYSPSESESRTPAATSGAKGLRTWAERGEPCEASADKYSLPELGTCGHLPSLRRGEEGLWPPRRPSPSTRRNKKRRDAARSRRDSLNSKGRRSSALGGIAGFGGSQTSLAGGRAAGRPPWHGGPKKVYYRRLRSRWTRSQRCKV